MSSSFHRNVQECHMHINNNNLLWLDFLSSSFISSSQNHLSRCMSSNSELFIVHFFFLFGVEIKFVVFFTILKLSLTVSHIGLDKTCHFWVSEADCPSTISSCHASGVLDFSLVLACLSVAIYRYTEKRRLTVSGSRICHGHMLGIVNLHITHYTFVSPRERPWRQRVFHAVFSHA